MNNLRRATAGFHKHGFRAEQVPDRPTHAASAGGAVALCGAPVSHVFLRHWGVAGPEVSGCEPCQRESIRLSDGHDQVAANTALIARVRASVASSVAAGAFARTDRDPVGAPARQHPGSLLG